MDLHPPLGTDGGYGFVWSSPNVANLASGPAVVVGDRAGYLYAIPLNSTGVVTSPAWTANTDNGTPIDSHSVGGRPWVERRRLGLRRDGQRPHLVESGRRVLRLRARRPPAVEVTGGRSGGRPAALQRSAGLAHRRHLRGPHRRGRRLARPGGLRPRRARRGRHSRAGPSSPRTACFRPPPSPTSTAPATKRSSRAATRPPGSPTARTTRPAATCAS